MCGHRRHRAVRDVGADIRDVETDPRVRASQAEREEVVERLRAHAGEGRLDLDELEKRVEAALSSRTRGELAELLADLPQPQNRGRTGVTRTLALGSLAVALLPLAIAVVLLALAPPSLAWVAWPLLGWWFFVGLPGAGLGFASCGHRRRRRDRTVIV
jgi:putative exporter of polyketide antibiotics